MNKRQRSEELFQDASKFIPGGVNSPVRAFKSVGGNPVFIDRAKGSRLWDVDGNEYIDYVNSWGPAIVGHAHPEVISAISEVASFGLSFGAPTERETSLAKEIIECMPSIEMIRFVSSGTEACMASLRVARAATKRDKILKFEGCYHGHGDMLLVKAGSGAATLGVPDSPGVPAHVASSTATVAFNDLGAVAALFEREPEQFAAVIVEPIVGNSGFIRPMDGFLEGLRALCTKFGVLLIFDEVMTGFRVGLGGVQGLMGIDPDITCLGKVIGGGMPLAAYGGKSWIMKQVAPEGPVYQAGTLSGNPLAVTCGLKTMEIIKRPGFYELLGYATDELVDGMMENARRTGLPFQADSEGGMFGFFFQSEKVVNFADAKKSRVDLFKRFFWGCLDSGIYLAPSAYEAGFTSAQHSKEDIEKTLNVMSKVMSDLQVS